MRVESASTRDRVRSAELQQSEQPEGVRDAQDAPKVDDVEQTRLRDEAARATTAYEEDAPAPLTARPSAPSQEQTVSRPAVRRGLSREGDAGVPTSRAALDDPAARARLEAQHPPVSSGNDWTSRVGTNSSATSSPSVSSSTATRPLSQSELARVGSAYADGKTIPNQSMWTEAGQGLVRDRAIEQGILGKDDVDKSGGVAHRAVMGESGKPGDPAQQFRAEDIAALARDAGASLEKMDPAQLDAAARYVNGAKTREEQLGRMHQTLDNLKVNERGLPELTKTDVKELTWNAARIPGHAIDGAKDHAQVFQDVAGALNRPGEHEFKIGKHNVDLDVGANGQVLESKTKKPSFLSKVGGVLKKVGSVALTVASFIPGPVGIAARIGSAVVSAVKAAKQGSVFGAIAGAAGAVAGGFAGIARGATAGVASTVANVSNRVAQGARGIQSAIQVARGEGLGGVLGGIAGAAGSVAGVVGSAAEGVSRVARNVETWARRGGSAVNVVDAARRGDVLGAAAGATRLGAGVARDLGHDGVSRQLGDVSRYASTASNVEQSVRRGDYLGAGAALTSFASTQVSDPRDRDRLERAGRALTSAGGTVSAIQSGDWTRAVASGTELASSLQRNGDLDDAAKVARSVDRMARAARTNDPQQMTFAAHGLRDTVSSAAESIRARHAPPPPPTLPVTNGLPADLVGTPVALSMPPLARGVSANNPSAQTTPAAVNGAADPGTPGIGPDGRPLLHFSTSTTVSAMAPGGPLRMGHRGDEVEQLQRDLATAGFGSVVGAPDGIYGPNTRDAVSAFQRRAALPETGQVDAATREALDTKLQYDVDNRRLNIMAQGKVDVTHANAAEFRKLSSPGWALVNALDHWERRADDLKAAIDRGAPNNILEQKMREVDEQQRVVEGALQGRDNQLALLQGVAETVKAGADLVIGAFGPPWLRSAYSGVSAGAEELATSGSVRDAFIRAAGGAVGELTSRQAGSIGDAVGRGITQATIKAGTDAIVDLQRIRTNDPAEAQRQAEAIIERSVARAVAGGMFSGSMHPFLDGIDPQSPGGKLAYEAAKTAMESTLRDKLLTGLLGGG